MDIPRELFFCDTFWGHLGNVMGPSSSICLACSGAGHWTTPDSVIDPSGQPIGTLWPRNPGGKKLKAGEEGFSRTWRGDRRGWLLTNGMGWEDETDGSRGIGQGPRLVHPRQLRRAWACAVVEGLVDYRVLAAALFSCRCNPSPDHFSIQGHSTRSSIVYSSTTSGKQKQTSLPVAHFISL